MSILGVLAAVRARLEGADFLYVPPLPNLEEFSQFIRLDVSHNAKEQATVSVGYAPDRLKEVSKIKVPILYFGIEGSRNHIVYPSLTYEIIDFSPRYTEFVYSNTDYGGDVYRVDVETSKEPVSDIDGTGLGNIPRLIRKRAIEHPYDYLVEIRAYEKDPINSAFLTEYVVDRFPPRHFIRVPKRDGTYRSWDMLHVGFQDLDQREAVRSAMPGIEREYAKAWTIRVEGYLDNTDTTTLEHVVQKRILTSENL